MNRSRVLAVAVVVLGLAACAGDPAPRAEPSVVSPSPVASVEASVSPSPSGEPSPPAGAPSIDDVAQDMAVTAAQEYLAIMGMSRDALIDQLASGEGYGTDVATAAVDSLDVDWSEQAARTAEQYASEGMTRAEIVQQLTSSYDRYTIVQAEYAADAVG